MKLEWTRGENGYEAASILNDEGSPFIWRVEIEIENGSSKCWWIKHSDDELLGGYTQTFGMYLDYAKEYCQSRENELPLKSGEQDAITKLTKRVEALESQVRRLNGRTVSMVRYR